MIGIEPIYLERLGKILPNQAGVISFEKQADETLIIIQTKTGAERFFVYQYRSHLTNEMVNNIIVRAQRHSTRPFPMLLLAPSIGGPLGAKLREAGVHYLDRSGNCYIAFGNLYIHIEGQKSPKQPSTDKGLRSAGYQVLFCFLAQPKLLNATMRAVAAAAGVSRQPVFDTKHRLIDDEYLIKTGSAFRWIPRRIDDALSLWLHGYETTVRPSLVRGIYRTSDVSPGDLESRIVSTFEKIGIAEFLWGGSAAGYRLTRYYRGERTVVHVHATPGDLRQQLHLLSDPRGNLVLMDAFGEINWKAEGETVHPLLVYSEMLRENSERANEAAQEIFEKYLQPLWGNET